MSLSLKHIPCPAGNNCTAFQCIFGHQNEKEKAHSVEKPAKAPHRDAPHSTQQDGPRKRQRLESPSETSGQHGREMTRKDTSSTNRPIERSNDTLITAKRPISPPPLRNSRPAQTSIASDKGASAVKGPAQASDTAPRDNSRQLGTSASASGIKKESLNPRLIKSGAPASHEIRTKLIKMLHQQFERLNCELKKDAKEEEQKFVLSPQALITRALDEEEHTAKDKPQLYSNLMKNKVMQFKRMMVGEWTDLRREEVKSKGGEPNKAAGVAGSDKPVEIETGLTPSQEVEILRRVLTPIDDLTSHGYVPSIPTDDAIEKSRQGVEASQGWEKCDRCQQRFQVFPGRRSGDGALTSGGTCVFHWGKAYVPPKAVGDKTRKAKRYYCCGEEVGDSPGCFKKDHHVFKASDPKRLASLLNFEKTPENPSAVSGRAVCFDCEMGYTVHGMELLRVTATSWPTGEVLLDVLVKPFGEILDLNSRFSGVWPEDMAKAKPWSPGDALAPQKSAQDGTGSDVHAKGIDMGEIKIVSSPSAARELLFSLISPSTPLIGHGLENDLNAMRIVHPALVDTVLLYPHRGGLPFRYSLKSLMETQLNKKIRGAVDAEEVGHDSAEDARAAGELARLRVMKTWKDMRWEGWKVDGDQIIRPEAWNPEKWTLTTEFIEK